MAKSRVTMQSTRAKEVSTQAVQMLNPDAWREGKTTAERGYGGSVPALAFSSKTRFVKPAKQEG